MTLLETLLSELHIPAGRFAEPETAKKWSAEQAPETFKQSWSPLLEAVASEGETSALYIRLMQKGVKPTYHHQGDEFKKVPAGVLLSNNRHKVLKEFFGSSSVEAAITRKDGHTTIRLVHVPNSRNKHEANSNLNESRQYIKLEYDDVGFRLTGITIAREDRAANGDLAVRELRCWEHSAERWVFSDKQELYIRTPQSAYFIRQGSSFFRTDDKSDVHAVELPEWHVLGRVVSENVSEAETTYDIHAYDQSVYYPQVTPADFCYTNAVTNGAKGGQEADCVISRHGVYTDESFFIARALSVLPVDAGLMEL